MAGWVIKNAYLTESEKKNNATYVYAYCIRRGWTINAIAGMLGNMESESHINPGLWQSLKVNYNMGFGLVQWTPASKYINWAKANQFEMSDPYGQLYWIDKLSQSTGQWIKTKAYPISWEEFKQSTKDEKWLASAFLKNFERAGVEVENNRRNNATKWLSYLGGSPQIPEIPPANGGSEPLGKLALLAMIFKEASKF